MDVNGWLRYLSICRSYGINHIRCHTWCPPDAAFAAADRLGVYIQPELPNWAPYGKEEHDRYLTAEGDRILKAFGNHPSFVMLSLGNEMGESREAMANLVRHLRDVDPSRLYVQGSNNFFWDPHLAPGDDYWTTMRTRDSRGKVHITRGSFATVDGIGHVQSGPPSTMADFSEAIAGVPVPVVGHETGQFTVYPDYREIPKYTGPLQARNLEAFREKLRARGMLDQAEDFRKASGALAVICYREEFESAIRTPGFGGFQVLDLQDFPGQGTALVGILDAFMDSKELVTPAAWREFCSETVLLARFDKYTWTTDEAFSAALDVAHYGATELPNAQAVWKLADGHGREVAAGETSAMPVTQGEVTRLGALSASLAAVHAPARLELELRLAGTEVVNHYSVWVYPPKGAASVPANVTLARSLDADARHVLAGGGRVLLIPLTGSLSRTVGGGFATDFWCWPMFHNKPGTMGLLCDPKHPALAGFPTETHSDWHWFHIASGARPIILDSTPTGFRPIIQVIDNLERDHKLGILFETHVGPGRLLICASDLLAMQDQPEARQLLSSLLKYCASDAFRPAEELPAATLDSLLQSDLALGKPATTSSVQTQPGFGPERANDGDASTRWCAADAQTGCWWQVDLGQPADLSGCEITWEFNGRRYQYLVEGSADGKNWETLSDQRNTQDKEQEQHLSFQSSGVRYLRITVTGLEKGAWASICDVKVFGKGDSP